MMPMRYDTTTLIEVRSRIRKVKTTAHKRLEGIGGPLHNARYADTVIRMIDVLIDNTLEVVDEMIEEKE